MAAETLLLLLPAGCTDLIQRESLHCLVPVCSNTDHEPQAQQSSPPHRQGPGELQAAGGGTSHVAHATWAPARPCSVAPGRKEARLTTNREPSGPEPGSVSANSAPSARPALWGPDGAVTPCPLLVIYCIVIKVSRSPQRAASRAFSHSVLDEVGHGAALHLWAAVHSSNSW